jgi:hypothetical protein
LLPGSHISAQENQRRLRRTSIGKGSGFCRGLVETERRGTGTTSVTLPWHETGQHEKSIQKLAPFTFYNRLKFRDFVVFRPVSSSVPSHLPSHLVFVRYPVCYAIYNDWTNLSLVVTWEVQLVVGIVKPNPD